MNDHAALSKDDHQVVFFFRPRHQLNRQRVWKRFKLKQHADRPAKERSGVGFKPGSERVRQLEPDEQPAGQTLISLISNDERDREFEHAEGN